MLVAELPNLIVDLVQHLTRLLQFFFVRATELRWIGKRPVQSRRHAWKNWAAGSFRFVAHRDHVGEKLPRFENIEDRACFVFGNIDPDLAKNFNHERIEFARLESGALCFKEFAAMFVEQRRRHLAARAVMHANEQDFLFHKTSGTAPLAVRAFCAISSFTSGGGRFENDTELVGILVHLIDVIRRRKEILIAVLDADFRFLVD